MGGDADFVRSVTHDLLSSAWWVNEGPMAKKRKSKIISKPIAPPVNEW
jgi:hypothetical protein